VLRPRFEAGASVWETPTGWLKIDVPLPHLARVTFRGHFTEEFVEPIASTASRIVLSGKPAIAFHDWEGMTNYDLPARAKMMVIAGRHLDKTERIHFITGSTIIRLAIQVANLPLRMFEVHPGRMSFEAAYARTIASKESGAPSPTGREAERPSRGAPRSKSGGS
jgi:hypothetical protein